LVIIAIICNGHKWYVAHTRRLEFHAKQAQLSQQLNLKLIALQNKHVKKSLKDDTKRKREAAQKAKNVR